APRAPPMALEARFCSARRASTRWVRSRRRSSAARSSSTRPPRSLRASAVRNGSGSSRISLMSSMRSSHLHLVGLLLLPLLRGRAGGLLGGLLRRARRGSGIHDALPVEDPALLDDEGLRRDVAVDPAAPCQVCLPLDQDVSLEAAGNAHVLRTDVGLDLRLR